MIEQYFDELANLIRQSIIVVDHTPVSLDQRTMYTGYVRGTLYIADGSILHFREYVDVKEGVERLAYSYHYQHSGNKLIFRYDNVEHYPDLPNFPHHKHDGDEANVISSSAPTLAEVLTEIGALL